MTEDTFQDAPIENTNVIALRRAKVESMRAAGKNLYGRRVDDLTHISEIREKYSDAQLDESSGAEVSSFRIAGRLMARRVMGKSTFANLKDESGNIQIYLQRSELGDEPYAEFKSLDIGDIILAEGTPFHTRTGELSLRVSSYELLSKSLLPLPEKFHGLQDMEQRYRQRYLDMICNDSTRSVLAMRSKIVRECRRFLDERGFMEVETPILQTLAGGAAARPFKTHFNALDIPMYLRIAPELYLKRLIVGGFEKVYEIGRDFRNEGMDPNSRSSNSTRRTPTAAE